MVIPLSVVRQSDDDPKPLEPTPATPIRPAQPKPAGQAANQVAGQAVRQFFINKPGATGSSVATSTAAVVQPRSVKNTFVRNGTVIRDLVNKTLIIDNKQYPLRTYSLLATPNDPVANQWWVGNTNLNDAWDTAAGPNNTLLAVIDTGFALNHEEFSNRLYTNPSESGAANTENPSTLNCTARSLPLSASCNLIDEDSNGVIDDEIGTVMYQNPSRLNCTALLRPLAKDCNRIDDDNNGLVDDVTGWDFANNDTRPQAGELNPNGSGVTHGTQTAGVAAATGNNAKGIAGVDWHTKILPIQAIDDDSYGDTLSVGRSILYAAAQGADVISLSLGSTQPDDYVRFAIAQATSSGSVVVASSGNSPCLCMVYPANYPEVVSVGALDMTNRPTTFSSYGPNLDLLAPGIQITSASYSTANPTATYANNLAGTSFAAPIVSGLMTRLLSSRPEMTPLQLMAAITENTNRLTLPANSSRTTQLGYGGLNALKPTSRVTAARNQAYTYSFVPVSKGAFLSPSSPTEIANSNLVLTCENSQLGTTPLYELTKAGANFWTISQTEVWQAEQSGYTARFFAEVCLQQPQDTANSVRAINLFKEFRNIYEAL